MEAVAAVVEPVAVQLEAAGIAADDSLLFLLSRPVSRTRVWFVKVGMAAVAFVAMVIGTTLIEVFYIWFDAAYSGMEFRLHVRQQIGPFVPL